MSIVVRTIMTKWATAKRRFHSIVNKAKLAAGHELVGRVDGEPWRFGYKLITRKTEDCEFFVMKDLE